MVNRHFEVCHQKILYNIQLEGNTHAVARSAMFKDLFDSWLDHNLKVRKSLFYL